MKVTTQLWGNSLGLRIPAVVARETSLVHGSEVELQVKDGLIVLRPTRRTPRFKLRTLVGAITARNQPGRTDWGAPVGQEVW